MQLLAIAYLVLVSTFPSLLMASNSELSSIAILPLQDPAGKNASKALIDSLASFQKISLIPLQTIEAHFGQKKGRTYETDLTEAQKNLTTGKKLYENLELKKSQSTLSLAKKQFRNLAHIEEAFEGLRAAQMQLALLYIANKQSELAKKELTELFITDPDRENRSLSEKQYPPEIRSLFEQVKESFKGKLNATLAVQTEPEGAMVYVNGKLIGASPTSIARLPQGNHFIFSNLSGYEDQSISKATVAGNNEIQLSFQKISQTGIAFHPVKNKEEIDREQISQLDTLAGKIKADVFVFLAPGSGEISAQLYDQRSQEVSRIVKGRSPDELAKKLIKQINDSGYVIAASEQEEENTIVNPKIRETQIAQMKQQEPAPKQHTDKPSIWKSPWLWGSVGGAIALSAGGWFAYDRYLKNSPTTTLTFPIPGR